MTKIGMLIPRPLRQQLFSDDDLAALMKLGELRLNDSDQHLDLEGAQAMLHDCDIGLGSWGTLHPGHATLMEACPQLRLWEHVAGTVKRMFGPHLQERNLCIASVKDAIAADVAELAHGLMILGLRNYFHLSCHDRSKTGVRTLFRKHIGIVGFSAVGKQVLKRLQNSGARLHVYDPYANESDVAQMHATLHRDLCHMAQKLDVISLHTPALDSTKHLLNAEVFNALPDDAIIINSSRGECLQHDDLFAALKGGRFQAFLDVTSPEPLPEDHPLLSLPNCHVSPHIAGPPSQRMGAQCVEDVQAFLQGGSPRAVITEDMLERIA